MQEQFFQINGTPVPAPQTCTWSLEDLAADDSGRTLDGTLHQDRIGQKRTLSCSWAPMEWQEVAALLTAVNASVKLSVTYPDLLSGRYETRLFYVGEKNRPLPLLAGRQANGGKHFL